MGNHCTLVLLIDTLLMHFHHPTDFPPITKLIFRVPLLSILLNSKIPRNLFFKRPSPMWAITFLRWRTTLNTVESAMPSLHTPSMSSRAIPSWCNSPFITPGVALTKLILEGLFEKVQYFFVPFRFQSREKLCSKGGRWHQYIFIIIGTHWKFETGEPKSMPMS